MPICQRAHAWVGGQVGFEPLLLVAADSAPTAAFVRRMDGRALRVQGDDVPAAEVVAVVDVARQVARAGARLRDAREHAGVREVGQKPGVVRSPRVPVVAVADGWVDNGVGAPEGGVIDLLILRQGAVMLPLAVPYWLSPSVRKAVGGAGDQVRDGLLETIVGRIDRTGHAVAEVEVRVGR